MAYDNVGREEFNALKARVETLEKLFAQIYPMAGKVKAILVEDEISVAEERKS